MCLFCGHRVLATISPHSFGRKRRPEGASQPKIGGGLPFVDLTQEPWQRPTHHPSHSTRRLEPFPRSQPSSSPFRRLGETPFFCRQGPPAQLPFSVHQRLRMDGFGWRLCQGQVVFFPQNYSKAIERSALTLFSLLCCPVLPALHSKYTVAPMAGGRC